MKYLWLVLVALAQAYFLTALSVNLIPNLVLIMIVYIGLYTPDFKAGLALSLWAGFWLDIASNNLFGYRLVCFGLLFMFLYWFKNAGVKINSFSFAFGVVLIASLLYNLGLWGVLWAQGGGFGTLFRFAPRFLWEAVLTAGLAHIAFNKLRTKWRHQTRFGI